MFINRIKIFDKIWMIKFQFGPVHRVGDNDIVLPPLFFEDFHGIPFTDSPVDGLYKIMLEWVVWLFQYFIAHVPQCFGIISNNPSWSNPKLVEKVDSNQN